MAEEIMNKIVALAKRRGFVFPGSEIYGGLAGTWDYGPVGALLKKNIKDLFWRQLVQERTDIVGVDAAIMMNPRAWEASGHLEAFTDPLVECKTCHQRFRADKDDVIKQHENFHKDEKVEWTEPQTFNLLVKASLGIVEGKQSEIFLRGEITNGVQVNFKNVTNSTRVKIPFGIAQMGKAFRNEITPGNFIFRSREFEQMETQYYIRPEDKEGEKWFEYWKENRMEFCMSLGLKKENLQFKEHEKLAHYAKAAVDIEYNTPWGWDEMMGIHNRGDWDLSRHQEYSGEDLSYLDPVTNERYIPWDIETSMGVDRTFMFLLLDAYSEDEGRVILKLNPKIAPYKVAVFPLVGNKPELTEKAQNLYDSLKPNFMVAWDDRGNIGKRYAAQDEIGTPWCVTIDYQTLEDGTATVRDRDTGHQQRIAVDKVSDYLQNELGK